VSAATTEKKPAAASKKDKDGLSNSKRDNVRKWMRDQRLLDARWYCSTYKLEFSSVEAAEDAFLSDGLRHHHNPNALFSSAYYAAQHTLPEGAIPFLHYAEEGAVNDLVTHPIIEPAYVRNQLDKLNLRDTILSALLHKCSSLRLDPHPAFSVKFYLTRYPELASRRAHPILHYLLYGIREKRAPHPLFWPRWVNNSQAKSSIGLVEYLSKQETDSTGPNPFFNPMLYFERYPDVKGAGSNALSHYLRNGQHERRTPNSSIDPLWIEEQHGTAMRTTGLDPLSFLIVHEGRKLHGNDRGTPLARHPALDADALGILRQEQFGILPTVDSKKTILFVSHNLRIQGAQTSLFELARGVRRRFGHHVMIMAPDQGPMKLRYEAEGLQVRQYKLPVLGLADEKHYQMLVETLQEELRRAKADIVHGNTIQSYHLIALARRLGIPTVWNIRESEDPASHSAQLSPGARTLMEEAMMSTSCFSFVALSTEKLWKSYLPRLRSVCINNGLDYTRLQPTDKRLTRDLARAIFGISENETVFLNVGTWTERKGQLDIVQALSLVDCRFWPRMRVILIGANESGYATSIRQELDAMPLALRNRIYIFPETASDHERVRVLAAYKASDVFLFPSRIESYPRVVIEALYFGLPVVSVPCFGAVEQIRPNETGRFYDAGDSRALSQHIEDMVSDRERRETMRGLAAKSAREILMQYDDMLRQYDRLYTELLCAH
jgi:glycosyltransferase involved in cell wall biosynthesis